MSLAIAFKGSEGVVLAADSRVTLTAQLATPTGHNLLLPATFDNATKLLKVNGQDYVGAVTFGVGAMGLTEPRTAHSYLTEFEVELKRSHPTRIEKVEEFAKALSDFFMGKWKSAGMPPKVGDAEQMVFLIGGYDEGAVYGRLFEVYVPNKPAPKEQLPSNFGALFGGQREFVDRLLHGYDGRLPDLVKSELKLTAPDEAKLRAKLGELATAIPYQFLPLQDCVDLSVFLIRTTINLQTWQVGVRGVGGAIDVATITQTGGFKALQQKTIRVASQGREKEV